LLVFNADYERIIVNIICVIVRILPAVEDIQRKRKIIWNHRKNLWFFDWDILNGFKENDFRLLIDHMSLSRVCV